MSNRILVTGATAGIGRLTVEHLVRQGHEVLVHGRSLAKVNALTKELTTAFPTSRVAGCVADLSDLSAVEAMGQQLRQEYDRLDVLINNAGVFLTPTPRLANGLDVRLVVNYFAPVLLTRELLPLLRDSNAPRVISLSSAAQAPVSLQALAGQVALGDQQAYAQSKLALLMWSFAEAKRHADVGFIAVNPGSLLDTQMVRDAYGSSRAPANVGADVLYALATDPAHADRSGEYFDNDRGAYGKAHSDAYDQRKLLELHAATTDVVARVLAEAAKKTR